MQLSPTCFGRPLPTLQELRERVRELGFSAVQPVPGEDAEDLPAGSDPASWAWLPSSILDSPELESSGEGLLSSTRARHLLRRAAEERVQGVVIELRELALPAAETRGDRLLERLRTEGSLEGEGEAWEAVGAEFEREAERALERVARFLDAIQRAAPGLQIALVAEEHPASILNPARFQLLREEAGLPLLRYWHDSGRVQTRSALGLETAGDWLDGLAAVTVGCTLSDWAEGEDLRLPGAGQVDFRLLGEYLPRVAKRVLHVAPVYPSELLPAARDALTAAGLE